MTIREKRGRRQTRQSPDAFGPNRLPPALFGQSNQTLEPTAGRRAENLKDEL